MNQQTLLTNQIISSIVKEVSQAFLGWELEASNTSKGEAVEVTAAVSITGDELYSVILRLPAVSTSELAKAMLCTEEFSEEDSLDAAGEFLNVIAGNIKSVLGADCVLGLPVLAKGSARSAGNPVQELVSVYTEGSVEFTVCVARYTKGEQL